MPEPVVTTVIAVVGLLLVAAVSAIGLRAARLPYSVGLVLVGLGLGYLAGRVEALSFLHDVELSPDIILFVFLPTLIFESAFNLDSRLLSKNIVPVLGLAAPGLLLSTALIGGLVAWLTPLALGPALLFGALISATDPVAVVALFRELGAPKRLAILVEGESLFNDATAIVLFHMLLAILAGGAVGLGTVGSGIAGFFVVFVGGLLVGGVTGYLMVRSIAIASDDPLVEVALSTVVAYAAFIAAEHYLHVSGVMSTVGAGVVIGAYGSPRFTQQVRDYLHQFWEFAAFVANGLIFLLVGLSVKFDGVAEFAGPIGWAIVAAVLGRGVVVFGLLPGIGRFSDSEPIDRRYQTVLWVGGLRGAVGLALAFSLPVGFADRDLIVAMAMGVVLFTLLTGGLSMRRVITALGLDEPGLVERMARVQAAAAAKGEALERIGMISATGHFSERLISDLQHEYRSSTEAIRQDLEELRTVCNVAEMRQAVWLEALAVEKTTYRDLFGRGFISEPVFRELDLALDLRRDAIRRGEEPGDTLPTATPLEVRFAAAGYRLLERLAPTSRIVQRYRLRALAAKYEHDTAELEGARRVRSEMEHLGQLSGAPDSVVADVDAAYERRGELAMQRIDGTAEHFPEYVAAVQLKTARRIALDGEAEAVHALAAGGGIPMSVALEARRSVEAAQRRLMHQPITALAPGPEDLLQRVPFFHDLAPDDFRQVVGKLVPRTVLAGEVVIRQGDRGNSLFLISRGVVAVLTAVAGEAPQRVASLYAGDFFGEMALLTDKPRNATVQAVTDCRMYELAKRDVDALCKVCEGARAALLEAAAERGIAKA